MLIGLLRLWSKIGCYRLAKRVCDGSSPEVAQRPLNNHTRDYYTSLDFASLLRVLQSAASSTQKLLRHCYQPDVGHSVSDGTE